MALVLANRVQDTTTTTGTGTVTLSGTAPVGYQTFGAAIGNGNTTYYTIAAGTEWEVGIGTYTSAGTTLSRDTVLSSSAGGTTKVTFSAGTKNVFVTYPTERSVISVGTSGGVPYYSSANAISSSALLAANALVIGGGAGAAPATTTTGTGVVTALGVNTGTAGAFVVNGGALGTPSSGTVTNLTGTASININGTVGATTPTTGSFTTITGSGLVNISAAGAGQIQFPASQNASAGANTLDDYEEGTWTAGLTFGGGSTGITFSRLNAYYTKIGNIVVVSLDMILSSKGSSTGDAAITGLPFAVGTSPNGVAVFAVWGISDTGNVVNAYGNGTTSLNLLNAANSANANDTYFRNASYVLFSGPYKV
jgi:hypothetical protein